MGGLIVRIPGDFGKRGFAWEDWPFGFLRILGRAATHGRTDYQDS